MNPIPSMPDAVPRAALETARTLDVSPAISPLARIFAGLGDGPTKGVGNDDTPFAVAASFARKLSR